MRDFIRVMAVPPQDTFIHIPHIIKVSANTDQSTCGKWTAFINTVESGTIRVLDTVDDILDKIREARK